MKRIEKGWNMGERREGERGSERKFITFSSVLLPSPPLSLILYTMLTCQFIDESSQCTESHVPSSENHGISWGVNELQEKNDNGKEFLKMMHNPGDRNEIENHLSLSPCVDQKASSS